MLCFSPSSFLRRASAAVILTWGLWFFSAPGQVWPQTAPALNQPELQTAISILEDEAKRAELIKALKTLAAEPTEEPAAAAPETQPPEAPFVAELETGVKSYLRGVVSDAYREVTVSGAGLRQTGREIKDVFQALARPEAVAQWWPYLLKICLWGLACLLATLVIIKKYARLPEACPTWDGRRRFKAVIKYLAVVGGPNLVLILTLLAMPKLSTTAPGVTVDMATGYSFIHSLIQHFFVNLSVLYITLEAAKALFTVGEGGKSVVDVHPVLSRHFLHSVRNFAIYLAGFVFIKETFLEHFVTGSLYALTLVLMTLPVPVYLTFRVRKLRRLVHAVTEAELSAGDQTEPPADGGSPEAAKPAPRLDYRADLFLKKHWATLTIITVWTLSLISVINPADIANQFAGRLAGSFLMLLTAFLAVKGERMVMSRFVGGDTEHGRQLLLNVDSLANAVVWSLTAVAVVSLWGLPVENIMRNSLMRELTGRLLAIAVTVTALTVFLKFSRMATEWLLSVPDLSHNRNWRTMTPLVLTAVRALAIFVAGVVILERLGVNIGPILAGAGILGLGVGMGAQSLVKDVINGISILLMDTLSVGDYVTIAGKSGTVDTVGLRSIRLRDSVGNLTVIPNSSVDTIVNMTRDYSQDVVDFIAPYDADPDQMLDLAREVAADLSSDRLWSSYLTSPANVVGIVGFDPNGTRIQLKVSTTAGNQWAVGRELRLRIKRRMLKEGFKSTWFGQNVFYFRGEGEAAPPDGAAGENAPPAK